jgi:hypothetical protein
LFCKGLSKNSRKVDEIFKPKGHNLVALHTQAQN